MKTDKLTIKDCLLRDGHVTAHWIANSPDTVGISVYEGDTHNDSLVLLDADGVLALRNKLTALYAKMVYKDIGEVENTVLLFK